MSLGTIANVCSHLQNASKARLGLTSVPSTKQTLELMLGLQRSGFISTVTRGGRRPPEVPTPTSMPHAVSEAAAAEAKITQSNIATRRLWLGLKYWNGEPVLSKMTMESRPKKRINLDVNALSKIVRGRDALFVKGIRSPGECLYLLTDRGLLEARECVERKVGGTVLCRAQ